MSAVFDYGYTNPPWLQPTTTPVYPFPGTPAPVIPSVPLPDPEAAEAIKRFIKLVDAAKEFDVASRQPNCEDPQKAKFMDEVLARLAAIEKRLAERDPA